MNAHERPKTITPYAAAAMVATAWFLLSVASYFLLAIPREHRFDFYPRWVGARAAIVGDTPYSEEVTTRIQEGMFGRRLEPAEDQHGFAYAPGVIWLLLPFWLLPFGAAISIWCGLQLLVMFLSCLVVASLLGWRVSPISLAAILLLSTLIYRYPINAYLLGQFIPFCMACLVAGWWGLAHGKPVIASVALIMSLIRPEVVVLPLIGLLVIAWRMNYRSVVWAWTAAIAVLWLLTRARIGAWEADFVAGLVRYQAYSSPVWPPGLVGSMWLALMIVVAVSVWSVWMWSELAILTYSERAGWVISGASLAGLVIFPQTGNYTLILGLLAVWMFLWVSRLYYSRWLLVVPVLSSPWFFLSAGHGLYLWERLLIPVFLMGLLTLGWHLRKAAISNEDANLQVNRSET